MNHGERRGVSPTWLGCSTSGLGPDARQQISERLFEVKQDIDNALADWEYKPGQVQARLGQAGSRQVIQMRVDLGILQLETGPRPDGSAPHGFPTYFAYAENQAPSPPLAGREWAFGREHC